jgi:hypothetical protein
MATRAKLRTTLRERLEDTSGSPLWSDGALNEYLVGALRTYGVTFPRQYRCRVACGRSAAEGVAVRDAHGRDVPKATERQGRRQPRR